METSSDCSHLVYNLVSSQGACFYGSFSACYLWPAGLCQRISKDSLSIFCPQHSGFVCGIQCSSVNGLQWTVDKPGVLIQSSSLAAVAAPGTDLQCSCPGASRYFIMISPVYLDLHMGKSYGWRRPES